MELQDNSVPAEKLCGNCKYGKAVGQDITKVVCFGVPPTPIMTGARQVGMQVQYQVELMRPQIGRGEPACSLWAKKIEIILGGS